jgi:hypothetical protein
VVVALCDAPALAWNMGCCRPPRPLEEMQVEIQSSAQIANPRLVAAAAAAVFPRPLGQLLVWRVGSPFVVSKPSVPDLCCGSCLFGASRVLDLSTWKRSS